MSLHITEEVINNTTVEDLIYSAGDCFMDKRKAVLKRKLVRECNEFLRKRLRELSNR